MIKKIVALFIALSLALVITGCTADSNSSTSGTSSNTETGTGTATSTNTSDMLFTNDYTYDDEDTNAEYSTVTAEIVLADSGVSITGTGARATGSQVEITSGGTFVISGTLSDGQIAINAPATATVRLILNGVNITSSKSSAIYCMQADKLIVTLKEGTQNTLTDAKTYTYVDATAEEPDAALFSKVDLSINGTGTLSINANFKNGIGTKDDLVIAGGTFNITSVNNAIRGRDSIVIVGGEFNLQAQNDGLQSNNDEDVSKGGIIIENGVFNITSVYDAIQAETTLKISGGEFHLTTGGGNKVVHAEVVETDELSNSYKGIKASGNFVITAGVFTIDSSDDALHSNSSIQFLGGEFTLSTGDDGVHADEKLLIADTAMNILTSYEGLEGKVITIDGGTIDIFATDDGINASDSATDASEGRGGRMGGGGGGPAGGTAGVLLTINGGTLNISSGGDAIDSNGNAVITGGKTTISGPDTGGNGMIDADGTFDIRGGTIIGVENSQGTAPSTSSTQLTFMVYFTSLQTAGKVVTVKSASGEVVATYAPTRNFKVLLVSSADLKSKETYTVYLDDMEVTPVTLSETITLVSDTGSAVQKQRGHGF